MKREPVSYWCMEHDVKRLICGCPVLPRSGTPDNRDPYHFFTDPVRRFTAAHVLALVLAFVLSFLLVPRSHAGENWEGRVMNGAALVGYCSVPLGEVLRCAADVMLQLNNALGTGIATASSYKLVSRTADTMNTTVGGTISIVVDPPGNGANATYTIVTDRVGSPAMEVSFIVFLVGLVACFGIGWIAGGQR